MWTLAAKGVPDAQQGIASGITSTAQQIGGALILAVQVAISNVGLSGLTGEALRQGLADGIERVVASMAILAAIGVAISLLVDKSDRKYQTVAGSTENTADGK